MKVELNKKYITTGGWDAIIHSVDGPDSKYPIIASVRRLEEWVVASYQPADFVEVREPLECWLWVEGSTIMGYSPSDKKETPKHRLFREVIE